jgi:hypothetical protein
MPGCPSEPGSMPWRSSPRQSEGANKEPWKRVAKDRALSLLWSKVIVETEAELVLKVLRIGTVSTKRLSTTPLQLLRGYELAAVADRLADTFVDGWDGGSTVRTPSGSDFLYHVKRTLARRQPRGSPVQSLNTPARRSHNVARRRKHDVRAICLEADLDLKRETRGSA